MAVGAVRSSPKEASSTSTGFETTPALEGGQPDISQFATIRRVHQTRRAAKSTRSSKASEPLAPSSVLSQRHKVCTQMADVIRRSSTGVERGVRWKSGSAPGTKDSSEVLQLSGNSANAELAAKERVNAVRTILSITSCILIYIDTTLGRRHASKVL